MSVVYLDSNYLVKILWTESGSAEVRALVQSVRIVKCSQIGRAEVIAAVHRKFREGVASQAQFKALLAQFNADIAFGGIVWLPVTDSQLDSVEKAFHKADETLFLRAADALHLASAAENGFDEIYSNDKKLLAATELFGLAGVDVVP